MADFNVKDGGNWLRPDSIHVKNSGSWLPAKSLHIKDGGSWTKVWEAAFIFTVVISSNTYNYNIKAAAISAGWDQAVPLIANITINSGVVVGSTSTSVAAFATGTTFPAGSTLTLTNNGTIQGMGGAGGYGAVSYNAGAGGAGGLALYATHSLTVDNTSGYILGGGGGGGGGSKVLFMSGDKSPTCSVDGYGGGGGGGGRGFNGGAGGSGWHPYNNGNAGTYSAAGGVNTVNCSPGGVGGGAGSAGSAGGHQAGYCGIKYAAGGGGAAGYAVSGNSNITWTATGTRTGPIA